MKHSLAYAVMLLFSVTLLTGCHTQVFAAGCYGTVIDAATGKPIKGAEITRTVASEDLPPWSSRLPVEVTVQSDKRGEFDLPPATKTEIAFMILSNPEVISGSFVTSAPGYSTNRVQGTSTYWHRWRVDLGDIRLQKISQ